MATNLSSNMNLPVPGVGTEAGPQYALDINNCLTIIDGHDHTPGSGVQLTPASLDINAELTINSNNLTDARSVRFAPQGAPLAEVTDLGCIYESGVDLYYNDGAGNQIRITQSGGIAGTPGSIANLVPPASASYVSANDTFVWQSDALTPANMDGASYILRNLTASSFGLTLSPPTIASDYTITLPQLPLTTLPLSISASGAMAAAQVTQGQLSTAVQARLTTAPTTQTFLSGSGNYNLPSSPVSPIYIRVRAMGGGGGGGGSIAAGSGGGTTSFGTSLITCTGGSGSGAGSATGGPGGAGGTATATGLTGLIVDGGRGNSGGTPSNFASGGGGAASAVGGGGGGGQGNAAGSASVATGGGGGGSGGVNNGNGSGGGGGAGAYVDVIIASPGSTYTYAVGAGGAAGAGGGAGGAGFIIVEEFY